MDLFAKMCKVNLLSNKIPHELHESKVFYKKKWAYNFIKKNAFFEEHLLMVASVLSK